VEVEDQGAGIASLYHERIFEQFFRIDDPALPSRPGTGLGLYIARELAARLGATLDLEWSQPGKGSRFVLSLPGGE
jgi:signal transduction histidine kinase